MVNGATVYVDGEVVGQRGGGQFVRPDAARVSQEF